MSKLFNICVYILSNTLFFFYNKIIKKNYVYIQISATRHTQIDDTMLILQDHISMIYTTTSIKRKLFSKISLDTYVKYWKKYTENCENLLFKTC